MLRHPITLTARSSSSSGSTIRSYEDEHAQAEDWDEMDSNEVQTFNFQGIVTDQTNKPWFIAHEVCEILEYVAPQNVVKMHCKHAKILKGTDSVRLGLAPRGVYIITESDLFRLVMKSQMPLADAFADWVVEEVLPQIRMTGGYIPIDENMTEQEILVKAYLIATETSKKKDEIIKNLKPKADLFEKYMDSDGLINLQNGGCVLMRS